MSKKKETFSQCQVKRKALVTIGTFNIVSGEIKEKEKVWKVEKCSVPLFSDDEMKTGVCKSCASGWSHPHNYAVDVQGKKISKSQLN